MPGLTQAGTKSPVTYQPSTIRLTGNIARVFTGAEAPYGFGISGRAYAGYRPLHFLSFGVRGGLASRGVSDATVNALERSAWDLGGYMRAYLTPNEWLELFGGVGVSYAKDAQSWTETLAGMGASPVLGKFTLVHEGIGIPIELGASYRFLRYFAVGPSFMLMPVVPTASCASFIIEGASGVAFCGSNASISQASSYYATTIALDLRVTFL